MGFLRPRPKKGYFFVIDAILAAIVLMLGIFILYSTAVRAPSTEPQFLRAEEFATTLTSTGATVGNTYYQGVLLPGGLVPYTDVSPLEELGYLLIKYQDTGDVSYLSYAGNYSESLMNDSLETYQGSAIVVNGTLLYARPLGREEFFLNRTLLAYVRMNATRLEGPLLAEVHLWG
jgi:hypothetical protein